jgi:hypothetical protein
MLEQGAEIDLQNYNTPATRINVIFSLFSPDVKTRTFLDTLSVIKE